MTPPASDSSPSAEQRSDAEAVDFAWKIHAAISDWTGKVDTKASFALTIETAAIVATVSLTADGRIFADLASMWGKVALWAAVACLVAAAVLAIFVVIPRLRRGALDSEAAINFIYFGHVRHWHGPDLANALITRPLLPVLSTQVVNMSKIAWRKHRLVQISLSLAAIAAAILLMLAASN